MSRKTIFALIFAVIAASCFAPHTASAETKVPKLYVIARADRTNIYVYRKTVWSTKFVKNADNVLFGYGGLRRIPISRNAKFYTAADDSSIKSCRSEAFRAYVRSVQYSPGSFKLNGKKIKMHMGLTSKIRYSGSKAKYIYDELL